MVSCVPLRALACWRSSAWCITGDVRLDPPDRLVELGLPDHLAGRVVDVDLHRRLPRSLCAVVAATLAARLRYLTASRATISTSPLFGPGTEPSTSSRLRSGSTRTTFRFCTVTRSCAHVAGHPHALEDAARRGAGADRAGRPLAVGLTVRLRAAAETVALDAALEAAALRGAGDVDQLARGEDVGR